MKKMVLVLAGMLASAGLVVADDSEKIIDSQDVYEENSADDGWTGIYGSLGLGWEWMENKGGFTYDDSGIKNGYMDKQKNNRFCGMLGLGGQMLFAQHFLAGLEFDCTFAKSEEKNAVLRHEGGEEHALPGKEILHIKNKGVSPALYAKLGYVFCNKHVVYTKLGVKWIKTRVVDMDHSDKDESFDTNRGVFAAALGYQCAFTKNLSGFAEVNYAGRNKVDHGEMNSGGEKSISLKTNEGNWGFSAGVSVRFSMN